MRPTLSIVFISTALGFAQQPPSNVPGNPPATKYVQSHPMATTPQIDSKIKDDGKAASANATPVLSTEDHYKCLQLAYMRAQLQLKEDQIKESSQQLDQEWREIREKYKSVGFEIQQVGPADFAFVKSTPGK